MRNAIKKLVAGVFALMSVAASGYEVGTHAAMTNQALIRMTEELQRDLVSRLGLVDLPTTDLGSVFGEKYYDLPDLVDGTVNVSEMRKR